MKKCSSFVLLKCSPFISYKMLQGKWYCPPNTSFIWVLLRYIVISALTDIIAAFETGIVGIYLQWFGLIILWSNKSLNSSGLIPILEVITVPWCRVQ